MNPQRNLKWDPKWNPNLNPKWNPKWNRKEALRKSFERLELLIRNPDQRPYMKAEKKLNETVKKP